MPFKSRCVGRRTEAIPGDCGWWVRLADNERVWMYRVPTPGTLGHGRYYFRDGGLMSYYPAFVDFMQTHKPERHDA